MTTSSSPVNTFDIHPNDAVQLIACMVYKGKKQAMPHVADVTKAIKEMGSNPVATEKDAEHAMLGIILHTIIPLHQNYRGLHHNADSTMMENQHKSFFGKIKDSEINITENVESKIKGKHSADYHRNIETTQKFIALIKAEQNKQEIFNALPHSIPVTKRPSLAEVLAAKEQAQPPKTTRSLNLF